MTKTKVRGNKMLGILGGMGPLASAEFLKTIYECNSAHMEQDSPLCILYSDPTFPDRTEVITGGSESLLLNRLVDTLKRLCNFGASKLVICCITAHYFLPEFPSSLKKKIISLIDVITEEVFNTKKRHLLLCTNGTRKSRIFERDKKWSLVEPYVILPHDEDQKNIHKLIYRIKRNWSPEKAVSSLNSVLQKYSVDSIIAGCTDIHLLTKYLMIQEDKHSNYHIVDPLLTLAKKLKRLIDA